MRDNAVQCRSCLMHQQVDAARCTSSLMQPTKEERQGGGEQRADVLPRMCSWTTKSANQQRLTCTWCDGMLLNRLDLPASWRTRVQKCLYASDSETQSLSAARCICHPGGPVELHAFFPGNSEAKLNIATSPSSASPGQLMCTPPLS